MCANGGQERRAFVAKFELYIIYISKSKCSQKCIIHKVFWKRGIYVDKWVLSAWGIKENKFLCPRIRNILPLNSTRPSNSTQQWGLKSLEEKLVKDEIIGYNEG
jgi:hypothetical protein